MLLVLVVPPAHGDPTCPQAAAIAEVSLGLPSGLLLAIGGVESGRPDSSGQRAPWPWTVQAAGIGRFFASAPAAVAAVQALRAAGVQSIDIGCFQINLLHHPGAFPDLAEGFTPMANALAAARFLRALHEELGSWQAAVAAYHSRTEELGGPYRARVLAAWLGTTDETAAMPTDAGWVRLPGSSPPPVQVWGPKGSLWLTGRAERAPLPRVVTLPAP